MTAPLTKEKAREVARWLAPLIKKVSRSRVGNPITEADHLLSQLWPLARDALPFVEAFANAPDTTLLRRSEDTERRGAVTPVDPKNCSGHSFSVICNVCGEYVETVIRRGLDAARREGKPS